MDIIITQRAIISTWGSVILKGLLCLPTIENIKYYNAQLPKVTTFNKCKVNKVKCHN